MKEMQNRIIFKKLNKISKVIKPKDKVDFEELANDILSKKIVLSDLMYGKDVNGIYHSVLNYKQFYDMYSKINDKLKKYNELKKIMDDLL